MAEQNEETLKGEIEELEKLEEDVKVMAQKIAEFRETLPGHLHNTLASILAAQRPLTSSRSADGSDPVPSYNPDPDENGALIEEDTEKIRMIKQKISHNASTMPLLLRRMKDCMSRIDKLNSFNNVIHPAFKRTRTR